MGAHVYVTLVCAGIAITAAAAYLIWVIKILWHVIDRLLTILRGVEGVTETTQPIGPIIDDINRDLDRSANALEACVQRLDERRQLAGAAAAAPAPTRTMLTEAPARPVTTEPARRAEVPASTEVAGTWADEPAPTDNGPAPAAPPPPTAAPPTPSWADEPATAPEPPTRRWWER